MIRRKFGNTDLEVSAISLGFCPRINRFFAVLLRNNKPFFTVSLWLCQPTSTKLRCHVI